MAFNVALVQEQYPLIPSYHSLLSALCPPFTPSPFPLIPLSVLLSSVIRLCFFTASPLLPITRSPLPRFPASPLLHSLLPSAPFCPLTSAFVPSASLSFPLPSPLRPFPASPLRQILLPFFPLPLAPCLPSINSLTLAHTPRRRLRFGGYSLP